MAKSAVYRLLLGLWLFSLIVDFSLAEKIKLKDGRVIEGEIISADMTGVRIKAEKEIFMIKNEDIESIVKEEKTVRIFLKDGNKVEGKVLNEDEKTIRIGYSNVEWQIKKENVQRIETLSLETREYKVPLPLKKPDRRYTIGFALRAGQNSMLEDEYNNGFIYTAGLSVGLFKNIALELNAGGFRSGVKQGFPQLSKGKISYIPFQLSLIFRVPLKRIMPYLSFGGSYYINKFALDEDAYKAWYLLGFEIEEEIKDMFGFHCGAGLDFFLTENFALNIDLKYNLAKTSGTWSMKDLMTDLSIAGNSDNIKLNSLFILAGLKLYF